MISMRKKWLSALVLVVIIHLLTACSSGVENKPNQSSSETGDKIAATNQSSNKDLVIMRSYHTGLEQFTGSDDINNNKLVNLLKEWSGFALNYQPLPKDNVSQKVSVLLASGDVPDLLWINGKSDYFKLAKQGSFEAVDDYIEQYIPLLTTVFTQEELDAVKLDGTMYGIPIRIAQKVGQGLLVRTDIMEEMGLKEPQTIEELYAVMKTIKANGKIPFTVAANFIANFSPIAATFGVGTTTIEKDGKLEFSWIQPEYKEFLTMMKQWYEEGLIDEEFAINKDVKDKMITGSAVISPMYWADAMLIDQAIKDKDGQGGVHFIEPPVGATGGSGFPEPSLTNAYVVIPKQAKNKVGAAEFYNFLLEDKTDMLITHGIENEDYTLENGEVVQTLEQSNEIPWRTLYFALDTDKSFNARLAAKGFLPYYEQLLTHKQLREETDYAPFVEAWDTKHTELRNYAEENAMKFVMNKRSLDEFDKYVAEFNARGGAAATEAINEWYSKR